MANKKHFEIFATLQQLLEEIPGDVTWSGIPGHMPQNRGRDFLIEIRMHSNLQKRQYKITLQYMGDQCHKNVDLISDEQQ